MILLSLDVTDLTLVKMEHIDIQEYHNLISLTTDQK